MPFFCLFFSSYFFFLPVVIEGASAGGDDLKFGTRQAILDTGESS